MSRVFQFPTRDRKATLDEHHEADVLGRIQIDATAEGDVITVKGAFTNRMQHGAYALTQALAMFMDKIAESGRAGHTSGPPIREALHRPAKALPPGLSNTNFGELHG